jgi:Tol biopolymer transport system component
MVAVIVLGVRVVAGAAGPASQPVRVVYASVNSSFGDSPNPENVADLFLLARGNAAVRRLTRTSWWEDDPDWSPDGRRIAFSKGDPLCTAGACEEGPISGNIWVRSLTSPRARRLTSDPEQQGFLDQSPTWSPDGRMIAYSRSEGYGGDPAEVGIYTIGVDGRNDTLLTSTPVRALDWSPQGSTIAFMTDEGRVGLVSVATGDTRNIAITNLAGRHQFENDLAWAPSGRQLAIATLSGVYVVSSTGGRARRVVKTRAGGGVTWSPNGRRLAFADVSGTGSQARRDIFVVSLSGRGLSRLTTTAGDDFSPDWRR